MWLQGGAVTTVKGSVAAKRRIHLLREGESEGRVQRAGGRDHEKGSEVFPIERADAETLKALHFDSLLNLLTDECK